MLTPDFLLTSLHYQRPSGTPSFAARRKIEEKGVPRRRKLRILRFAFSGKSSVVPLLLLSPPNPLCWASAGPLLAARWIPGVMVWRMPDVLCAYLLATVHLTRLSRAWRAPHCFHALCVLRCSGRGNAYDLLRSLRGALVRRGNPRPLKQPQSSNNSRSACQDLPPWGRWQHLC